MDATTTEQPSTSSSAKKQIKINSATNQSSTTNTATVTAAKERKATTTPTTNTPTPTLAQIGRQTSHNFRLSQISDSGAESGDEQTRLIRSPSSRSHKFIIIPATPPSASGGGAKEKATLPFRPTISASSLSTLAAAIQKTPATSQPPLTRPRSVARQLSAAATAATAAPPTLLSRGAPTAVNQSKPTPHAAFHSTPATSLTRSAQSQSDVVHQPTNTKTPATIAALLNDNSAGVTFTIEDCESEGVGGGYDERYSGDFSDASGGGVPVYDATLHPDNATAIKSIKSAAKLAPSYTIAGIQTPLSTSTTALVTASTAPSATAVHPFYRGALPSNEASPYMQAFSRGRSERSSMRSVVSAYMPGSQDPLAEALAQYELLEQQQQQQLHYLRPSHSGKDLSTSSSFIYGDHVANQIYSDVTSVRSLASIGIGSTDGRRLVIRRVPHTPHELFNMVHPPTPP